MIYQDAMAGKQWKNAQDFVHLIKEKTTSLIVHEIVLDEIINIGKSALHYSCQQNRFQKFRRYKFIHIAQKKGHVVRFL